MFEKRLRKIKRKGFFELEQKLDLNSGGMLVRTFKGCTLICLRGFAQEILLECYV